VHRWLLLLGLSWGASLGNTGNDDAVANEAFDEPVVITIAGSAVIDALLAKIEITFLANAAVIVLVGNRLVAAIAINAEGASVITKARRSGAVNASSRLRIGLGRAECARHACGRLRRSCRFLWGHDGFLNLAGSEWLQVWQQLKRARAAGQAGRKRLRENSVEVRGPRLGLDASVLCLLEIGSLVVEEIDRRLVQRHSGGFESKLQLRFGGTIELLVY
jgi:hypothetical protein